MALTSCSGGDTSQREPAAGSPTPTVVTAAPTPTPSPSEQVSVLVSCSEGSFVITEELDFSEPWTVRPASGDCDAQRSSGPLTDIERRAYKRASYDSPSDIAFLYSSCAEVDRKELYASAHYTPSRAQVEEINGILTLCPNHPLVTRMRATAKRGGLDIKLEDEGRLFGSGTYLVGKEIKPGTYVAKGEIENCYWERQNRSGETIDNNFVLSARRVEVVIRSTDYAFHSEGCGLWRPQD
jgi:hypothetical protein